MHCMGKGKAELIMEMKGWVGREKWGGTLKGFLIILSSLLRYNRLIGVEMIVFGVN